MQEQEEKPRCAFHQVRTGADMADSHGTLCDGNLVRRLLAELEAGRSFVI